MNARKRIYSSDGGWWILNSFEKKIIIMSSLLIHKKSRSKLEFLFNMCNFWNAKIDANGAINFSQRVSLRKHVFENRQENIFNGKDKMGRGFVRNAYALSYSTEILP